MSVVNQRIKANAWSYAANFAVTALLNIIVSPLLVHYLGATHFGIWKTCQKIMDFASVVDGRGGQALKWILARQEASSDILPKRRAVGSALYISCIYLPILLLLGGMLSYFLPALIHGLSDVDSKLVRVVGAILAANIILNPLLGIPDAVFIGSNQGYKSIGTQTIWLIISNALMVIAVFANFGLMSLAVIVLGVTIANALTVYMLVRRDIAWWGVAKPTRKDLKSFFGFSSWVLVWSFLEKLLLSQEMLMMGFLVGPGIVTQYIFSAYPAQLVIAICLLAGSSVMPAIGRYIGSDPVHARALIARMRNMLFNISILAVGMILLFDEYFVRIWVGGHMYFGPSANFLLCILILQIIAIRNESQIQDLTLKIGSRVVIGSICAGLSFALAYLIFLMLPSFPVEAILLGVLLGRVPLILLMKRDVDRKLSIAHNKNYLNLIFSLLLLFGCYQFSVWRESLSAYVGYALTLVAALVFLFLIFVFVIKLSGYRELVGVLRKRSV